MGMAVGGTGGPKSDINMTPMIDVLLVLIIIFMVITPLTPKGLEALVPQPPPPGQQAERSDPHRGDRDQRGSQHARSTAGHRSRNRPWQIG